MLEPQIGQSALGGLAWGFWHGGLKVGANLLLAAVIVQVALGIATLVSIPEDDYTEIFAVLVGDAPQLLWLHYPF